jgi:3-methyladenine DNA glycosylase AlkD
VVASAGWALTTERVARNPDGLDPAGLLDVIEAERQDTPERLQWAMNHCLAQIGSNTPGTAPVQSTSVNARRCSCRPT